MLKILTGLSAIGIIFGAIFLSHVYTTENSINTKNIFAQDIQKSKPQLLAKDEGIVERIVDGDTITVLLENNKTEKIRIIGMNAPESVDPRRGVECFGKEASRYLNDLLRGKKVRLEKDGSQQNYDKYGRALRHVFLNEINIAESMIREGYAYEYTYNNPYAYQKSFKIAQQEAQKNEAGLWAPGACK